MTGGGYYVEEVGPGFFYVVARSTVGPVSNIGAARHMWENHAGEVCKSAFRELEIVEYVDESLPPVLPGLRYLVSTRKGYALCGASPLSLEGAMQRLDEVARIEASSPVAEY